MSDLKNNSFTPDNIDPDPVADDGLNKALNYARGLYPDNEIVQNLFVKEYTQGKEVLTEEENLLLTRARMQKVIERKSK